MKHHLDSATENSSKKCTSPIGTRQFSNNFVDINMLFKELDHQLKSLILSTIIRVKNVIDLMVVSKVPRFIRSAVFGVLHGAMRLHEASPPEEDHIFHIPIC